MVASLPTIRIVLREGPVSPDLVNELRRTIEAARAELHVQQESSAAPPNRDALSVPRPQAGG